MCWTACILGMLGPAAYKVNALLYELYQRVAIQQGTLPKSSNSARLFLVQAVDPLATIVHRDAAYKVGKALTARLKELIPRQQFKVPIQAAIGARIVASEAISGTSAGHHQLTTKRPNETSNTGCLLVHPCLCLLCCPYSCFFVRGGLATGAVLATVAQDWWKAACQTARCSAMSPPMVPVILAQQL